MRVWWCKGSFPILAHPCQTRKKRLYSRNQVLRELLLKKRFILSYFTGPTTLQTGLSCIAASRLFPTDKKCFLSRSITENEEVHLPQFNPNQYKVHPRWERELEKKKMGLRRLHKLPYAHPLVRKIRKSFLNV